MKKAAYSDGSAFDDETTDLLVAAALRDDADIPAASAAFTRNCMSALSGSGGNASGARLFKAASASALLASLTTWAVVTCLAPEPARNVEVAPASVAAVADDVSMVGVNTPQTGAVASADGSTAAMAMSNECMVNANPGATALWKALNAGQSQMAWEWPDEAKSAKLTITGRGLTAEKIYCKADAFPVWNPPVPKDFNEDDVYTARLTFYDGERGAGDEVSCLVAEGIGFVHGVSGEDKRLSLDGAAMFQIASVLRCGQK